MPNNTQQYPNLKTFISAVMKPYITALQTLYVGQVKYMMDHLTAQENSITSLQEQVAKLSNIVLGYEAEVIKLQGIVQDIQKNSYSTSQVSELSRRVRELEAISLELYTLVDNKIPDSDLPDFDDPILPEDPLPTKAQLESKWRADMGITDDSELDGEQIKTLNEYIHKYYSEWPYPPTYDIPSEADTYWTDAELTSMWYNQNHISEGGELTEDQRNSLQSYLDYYSVVFRPEGWEPPKDEESDGEDGDSSDETGSEDASV